MAVKGSGQIPCPSEVAIKEDPINPELTMPKAPPLWSGFGFGAPLSLALLALVVAFFVSLFAAALAQRQGIAELDRQLKDRSTFAAHTLAGELERMRHLPLVLGEDPRLRAALLAPNDPAAILAANDYLKTQRGLAATDEAYLIDVNGLTIAASNWDEPGSYLGMSYGFRPYFTGAMAEGQAHYYAIGVTTGKPGAFLSARIATPAAALGVVVVKMDLAHLESTWARAGETTLVLDSDGVSFLAAQPRWRFRPLLRLDPSARQRLEEEQRYAGVDLSTVPLLPVRERYFYGEADGTMRQLLAPVPGTDWQIMVALSLAPVNRMVTLVAALAATAGALATMGLVFLLQRRQLLRLRLSAAEGLEKAVELRTRELAAEVEERRRAEAELIRTQEGLVHAAKLAVLGRMSAAIVHEVGQSLSALDNNLAAAELHGAANGDPKLAPALTRARKMLRRLQGVVSRLRSFGAKQSPVALSAVAVGPVLRTALEIVAPRARELSVTLDLPLEDGTEILADGPRLEQVITNLFLNAAEASALVPAPRVITVELQRPRQDEVDIVIADRGPGISPSLRAVLGQPFMTEGKAGEGLGLGLYIVQSLLEQMQGRITFAPHPEGSGTEVRLCFALPKTSAPERSNP